MSLDVLVVGSGVTGLTTAVALAEAGLRVEVVADRPAASTTSAVAGASWGPYLAGHRKVTEWSEVSRAAFTDLATDRNTGVRLASGTEAYANMAGPPDWALNVESFRHCSPEEVPTGYTGAWRYRIPLIDMPRYLGYLEGRLQRNGSGIRIIPTLRDFSTVLPLARVVVNCTGLGSRELVGDDRLVACGGQLTVVANPGVTEFFQDNVDDDELTCIFPHGETVVLGGITVVGDDSPAFDPVLEERMMARCVAIEPKLADAPVVDRRVGVRPQRDRLRVEWDDNLPVIHNYGHGGSGVTLSWGCAAEVVRLLRAGRSGASVGRSVG